MTIQSNNLIIFKHKKRLEMLRGEKRVVWIPHKGCSKYPEKKPRRPFGSFISLLAFCLFWIGNYIAYLIVNVFVSNTWIFSEWLNPNSIYHLFPWYIAIPSYKDWTNPNTILQFVLIISLVIRNSCNPWVYFHIEVSCFKMICIRYVRMRKKVSDRFDKALCCVVDPLVQDCHCRVWKRCEKERD